MHMVRNTQLWDPADRLLMHNLRFWRSYWASRPARHHTMIPHDALLTALETHDAEGAARAMREHLVASRQLLQATF
jgi:DNA-binding GntR family transcriptional regulator